MPNRIQRKRTKGWRMPEGAVSVTRPGIWGNPFAVGQVYMPSDSFYKHYGCYLDNGRVTSENRLIAFRAYAERFSALVPNWLAPLHGKDLACWCPVGSPCHADVLLGDYLLDTGKVRGLGSVTWIIPPGCAIQYCLVNGEIHGASRKDSY